MKKPRYLTFSLRTLFILLTALAVWLGVVVHRAREQRQAEEAIEAVGGAVDWKPVGPEWLGRFVGGQYFRTAREVYLMQIEMPADDTIRAMIPHLQRLRGLKQLDLPDPISPQTEQEVRAALPGCTIVTLRQLDYPKPSSPVARP